MRTGYILLGVGAAFIVAAIVRLNRDGGKLHPQSKAWLIIAGIFGAVGTWLVVRS